MTRPRPGRLLPPLSRSAPGVIQPCRLPVAREGRNGRLRYDDRVSAGSTVLKPLDFGGVSGYRQRAGESRCERQKKRARRSTSVDPIDIRSSAAFPRAIRRARDRATSCPSATPRRSSWPLLCSPAPFLPQRLEPRPKPHWSEVRFLLVTDRRLRRVSRRRRRAPSNYRDLPIVRHPRTR